jgi:hypothetical protein
MIPLLVAAAAHAYLLPWGLLFELPVPGERACAVSSLHYGPPDGKWERGSQQEKPSRANSGNSSCRVRRSRSGQSRRT